MRVGALRGTAEQVLKDVEQRSRLCRQHAAELARRVLDLTDGDAHPTSPIWSSRSAVALAAVALEAADLPTWRPVELGGAL